MGVSWVTPNYDLTEKKIRLTLQVRNCRVRLRQKVGEFKKEDYAIIVPKQRPRDFKDRLRKGANNTDT